MLVSEQVLEIARNLNRPSAEVSAQCVPLLNSWQRDWNTRWPYADYLETSATFAASAGTQVYSLSATVDKLRNVWCPTDNTYLSFMTEQQLRIISPSTQTGVPNLYAPFGDNQILLYPVPADARTINYSFFQNLSDITTGTLSVQQSGISPKYHDAGVWYSTWRLAQRMGDNDLVALATAEYNRIYEIAKQDMIVRASGSQRVRVGGEFINDTFNSTTKAQDMFFGSDN